MVTRRQVEAVLPPRTRFKVCNLGKQTFEFQGTSASHGCIKLAESVVLVAQMAVFHSTAAFAFADVPVMWAMARVKGR